VVPGSGSPPSLLQPENITTPTRQANIIATFLNFNLNTFIFLFFMSLSDGYYYCLVFNFLLRCSLRCPQLACNVPAAWRRWGFHYTCCRVITFKFPQNYPTKIMPPLRQSPVRRSAFFKHHFLANIFIVK